MSFSATYTLRDLWFFVFSPLFLAHIVNHQINLTFSEVEDTHWKILTSLVSLLWIEVYSVVYSLVLGQSKIKKRAWVLHECLERVPENVDAAKKLLQYGLKGTDLEALVAIGKGEDGGRCEKSIFLFVFFSKNGV